MEREKEYISKRMVVRNSQKEFSNAATQAMKENGYVIVAKDGWIVRELANGDTQRLRKIDSSNVSQEIRLD